MSITNITSGQQTVTAIGAVTPTAGLDISGVTGDCTIHLRVAALSSVSGVPKCAISFEDSVNGFVASVPVTMAPATFQGSITSEAIQEVVFRKYQLSTCRFGTASAVLRANVVSLGGTTPSLSLWAWLEQ